MKSCIESRLSGIKVDYRMTTLLATISVVSYFLFLTINIHTFDNEQTSTSVIHNQVNEK